MAYFDYSATTPIDQRVLDYYVEVERSTFGNANSVHRKGQEALAQSQQDLKCISRQLGILKEEFILTSSAVESNNLAIKGTAYQFPHRKHIITSSYEHASVIGAISGLGSDYDIDFVGLDDEGFYDLVQLKSLFREDTLLVSLVAVDSETGLRQDVEEIAKLCRASQVIFHCDATQALGKCKIDFKDMDLVSVSAHKIYGPKGVAALIKKKGVELVPLFHGGHSFTPYRSSTPAIALLAAFRKALELSQKSLNQRMLEVAKLNAYAQFKLRDNPKVQINSTEHCIPFILNLSIEGAHPEEDLLRFSDRGVYLSSKSACSGQEAFSKSVYALTKNETRATTSFRVSLSHLNSYDDIDDLCAVIKDLFE